LGPLEASALGSYTPTPDGKGKDKEDAYRLFISTDISDLE